MTSIQEKFLVPISVNVTTAIILFLISLFFSPVRNFILGRDVYTEYPLFCTAEPVTYGENRKRLGIDMMIINKTLNDYNYVMLNKELKKIFGPDSQTTPLIVLNQKKIRGKFLGNIISVEADKSFNKGKGTIIVKQRQQGRITISVREIKKYSVLRIRIEMDGLDIPVKVVTRQTKLIIPFDLREIERNCFSMGVL